MLSDASGQYEAVIFSETLARSRELLEPGTPLLLTVEAERDGETLKMRVQSIEPLETAAANVQRGLKLVLDRGLVQADGARLDELSKLLKSGGKGEIRLVVPLPDRGQEVEFTLPGRYEIGPMQMGELSTLPGVLEVLEI
jgi:DNA polymerase-3 subunit alpha